MMAYNCLLTPVQGIWCPLLATLDIIGKQEWAQSAVSTINAFKNNAPCFLMMSAPLTIHLTSFVGKLHASHGYLTLYKWFTPNPLVLFSQMKRPSLVIILTNTSWYHMYNNTNCCLLIHISFESSEPVKTHVVQIQKEILLLKVEKTKLGCV